jgi:hypothetical protein
MRIKLSVFGPRFKDSLERNYCTLPNLLIIAISALYFVDSHRYYNSLSVEVLSSVKVMNGGYCRGLTTFSALKNSLEIDLTDTLVDDVSCLGHVKKLVLSRCYELRDVSALRIVQYLDLSFCRNVDNVSMLGNVISCLGHCDGIILVL